MKMARRILSFSITLLVMMLAACAGYQPVEVSIVPARQFEARLVFEGRLFTSADAKLEQIGGFGDSVKAIRESLEHAMVESRIFRETVIADEAYTAGEENDGTLYMKAGLEHLSMVCPLKCEVRIVLWVSVSRKEGFEETFYLKMYDSRAESMTSTLDAFSKALSKLLKRALQDLASGDFDNPDYKDAKRWTISL